ncbi:MAG: hypothetical protein FWE33_05830 [Defluviitaleaceae bacterium]|nr:hypothetical protein [Defluviitaleaceae bacterium]
MHQLKMVIIRKLLLVLVIISAIATIGCGRSNNVLPTLKVQLNEQSVQALQGTTNWCFNNGNYDTCILSDSPHPLQLSDEQLQRATLILNEGVNEITLNFTPNPQTIRIVRWLEGAGYEDFAHITIHNQTIQIIDDGNVYIYEVFATWEQGSSSFAFRTTN